MGERSRICFRDKAIAQTAKPDVRLHQEVYEAKTETGSLANFLQHPSTTLASELVQMLSGGWYVVSAAHDVGDWLANIRCLKMANDLR